jgi:CHAT domain-containing protein
MVRSATQSLPHSSRIALPESRHEVESIASDLPKPDTVLLGSAATETQFKRLPLSQYNVLHLALHGYADVEYSDRSALVFAPEVGPGTPWRVAGAAFCTTGGK